LRYRYEKVSIILLIIDRKSFAHDVHALARFGRRVCVVLIGEDRLETNFGFTVPLRIRLLFESLNNDVACGGLSQFSRITRVGSLALVVTFLPQAQPNVARITPNMRSICGSLGFVM
jgi:hypothetical protein